MIRARVRVDTSCGWRFVVSPMIPQDFPTCHNSSVSELAWLLLVRDGAGFPDPPQRPLRFLPLITRQLGSGILL